MPIARGGQLIRLVEEAIEQTVALFRVDLRDADG